MHLSRLRRTMKQVPAGSNPSCTRIILRKRQDDGCKYELNCKVLAHWCIIVLLQPKMYAALNRKYRLKVWLNGFPHLVEVVLVEISMAVNATHAMALQQLLKEAYENKPEFSCLLDVGCSYGARIAWICSKESNGFRNLSRIGVDDYRVVIIILYVTPSLGMRGNNWDSTEKIFARGITSAFNF
jgi:hypothetical protein